MSPVANSHGAHRFSTLRHLMLNFTGMGGAALMFLLCGLLLIVGGGLIRIRSHDRKRPEPRRAKSIRSLVLHRTRPATAAAEHAHVADRPCRCAEDRAFLKIAFPTYQCFPRRGGG